MPASGYCDRRYFCLEICFSLTSQMFYLTLRETVL